MDGLTVEVLDAERRRINKVRICKQQVPEPTSERVP
jgi:CBS domain containing-hemolysin-like protein